MTTELENSISESDVNFIAEETKIEGKITLPKVSRVHGTIRGEVFAPEGSELIISETGLVEGTIDADTVFIDGFVKGDVRGKKRIVVSATGRVIGNLHSPSVRLDFGSFFEGQCKSGST